MPSSHHHLDVLDGPTASADPYEIAGWDARAPTPGLPAGASRRARHIAEALFSTEDGPPPPARLDWMEKDLGDFFGHANWRAAALFRACVFTVTWLAPVLFARLPPLGRLAIPERVEAIERFEGLPVTVLTVLAVKAILSLIYYEHPDAAAEIGWDQECVGRQSPR